MSKQAQLPPRVPVQKKNAGPQKANLQSSVPQERPTFADLLSELDPSFTGITSDSFMLSKSLMSLPDKDEPTDVGSPDTSEADAGFESSWTYGPNSPRRKSKTNFPENEIVSAFPDYVVQNPVQHLDGHVTVSGVPQSKSSGNGCASAGVTHCQPGSINSQHEGKRSRIRKLQYINNLEVTIQNLQSMNSSLNSQVAYYFQQNGALSMENDTLIQQLLIMQQEKFILDGKYVALKQELDRIKASVNFAHAKEKLRPDWSHPMPKAKFSQSDSYSLWGDTATLDLEKLNLQ